MRRASAQLRHHSRNVRQDFGKRRAGHGGDEHVARADALELALAVDHARPALAPADAGGMSIQPGMLQPDLVRYRCRCNGKRPSLQEMDPRIVQRPFDFGRAADDLLALAHKECELGELPGIEARRAEERARERPPAVRAAQRVVFLAERRFLHATRAIEHVAVRHHLALRDGSAQPLSRVDQHLAPCGAREPSARDSCGNERLDEERHRSVGWIQTVGRHVAKRPRRPKRGPAGAYRGEKVFLAFQPEVALELAGETRSGAILDERR